MPHLPGTMYATLTLDGCMVEDLRLRGAEIRLSQGRWKEALDILLQGKGIESKLDEDDPTRVHLCATDQTTQEQVQDLIQEAIHLLNEINNTGTE